MLTQRLSHLWNSTRRWLPGLLISLAFIVLFLTFIDVDELVAALRKADIRFLLAGSAVSVGWLLARGLVWQTLLRRRTSFRTAFLTICEGYLLNNFFPFRLGEVGRAFLISRKSPVKFMEAFSTILIERVLDLTYSAGILLLGVTFFVQATGANRVGWLVSGVMLLGLLGLYLLARHQTWALERFRQWTAHRPHLQQRGERFFNPFSSAYRC
ncbi:MAG: lysylphosphatidylglycerol synthase transmembrane domain-containing protein [Anaerolineales bacterium]|nr:lysylphosphatidylglycerol synthase transmembrane domain-containing protein [Anaerolineales bacterium]